MVDKHAWPNAIKGQDMTKLPTERIAGNTGKLLSP